MYPSHLIYKSLLQREPLFKGETKCVFCKSPAPKNLKKVIKNTFTDLDYLQKGEGVCEACEFVLTDRKENSVRKMSAIFHEKGFLRFTALELADILFNFPKEIEPPFFFHLSYSKKKHLFFKGKVSFNKEEFWIQTDEGGFYFEPHRWKNVFKDIQNLYSIPEKEKSKKNPKTFFTKEEILTLNPNPRKVIEFGIEEFFTIKKRLEKVKNTLEYNMLVYAVRPK